MQKPKGEQHASSEVTQRAYEAAGQYGGRWDEVKCRAGSLLPWWLVSFSIKTTPERSLLITQQISNRKLSIKVGEKL